MERTQTYVDLEKPRKLVVWAFLAAALWYLTWRLGTFNAAHPWFSAILYVAELYGAMVLVLHIFTTWRLTVRTAPPPRAGLKVAVLITTRDESATMLRQTLLGAVMMDYPHETWLLDDGNRPEVRRLADELGCSYVCRKAAGNGGVGALNNALRFVDADYVAVFEGDHVPNRRFLTRTLGYFSDPKVAFVQTPQDFYNLDSYQHRWNRGQRAVWIEQALFSRVIQRGKDHWNAALFCGSCAVVRRSALDEIGGFAVGTVAEDLHTSVKLHKRGYRSVYHAESLAFGVAPATISAFLARHMRRVRGGMQVWRKEGIFFARGLTLAQRLAYLGTIAAYLDGWQRGIFYVTPAIVLFTGWLPVNAVNAAFLAHFVPYLILMFWAFEEVGRGYGGTIISEAYRMARFSAFAAVGRRPGNAGQSKKALIAPQATILALSLLAIPSGFYLRAAGHGLPLDALLANALWACVNGSLALFVATSTLMRAHRRKEYRFPIPLAVQLGQPNGALEYGTMDDVSSSGFRLYSRSVRELQSVERFRGLLFLPNGEIEFAARAVPGTGDGAARGRTVGCEFIWQSKEERDRLNLFLYGSDMQWRIHALRERISTPVELLAAKFTRRQRTASSRSEHWAPAMYYNLGAGGSRKLVGLVSTNVSGDKRLMLFDELAENTEIRVSAFGKYRLEKLTARVGPAHVLDSNVFPVYMYELNQA